MPEFNKTFITTITNYGFHTLSQKVVNNIYKDGRVFSHFMEHQLAQDFGLTHVTGCKGHDLTDPENSDIQYEQKTFTKKGCKLMPSNMIGTGRKFDKGKFIEKATKLNYIVVSNIEFPIIKIKFVSGSDIISRFPNGKIFIKDHDAFFTD
jgi:hypothetical protein